MANSENFEGFAVIGGEPMPVDLRDFFALFGAAMTTWQEIELGLSNIANCSCCAINGNAFHALFAKFIGFGARLAATTEAVHHAPIADATREEWAGLSKWIQKLSGTRNKLIHGKLYGTGQGHVIGGDLASPRAREKMAGGNFGLDDQEILEFVAESRAAFQALRAFEWRIVKELDYSDDPNRRGRFATEAKVAPAAGGNVGNND